MGDTAPPSKSDLSIGITQRTTPLACPWTGNVRMRFTDFQVNEIWEDGSVVHLTNIPSNNNEGHASQSANGQKENSAAGSSEQSKVSQTQQQQQRQPVADISAKDEASLASIAGNQFARDCIEMFKAAMNDQITDADKKKRVTAESTDDRSRRAKIHQEVRRIFNSKIDTTTDKTGTIVATLVERKGKKRSRNKRSGENAGSAQQQPKGEYLHFTLHKENRDTMEAVNLLARRLRVKPQSFGYAGTKDRRASTAQRCSIRFMQDKALAGINGNMRGVTTGDYEYKENPIYLGQLLGNEFVITLKNCQLANESGETPVAERLEAMRANVQPALDHMARHGWINYFGHQRFGTHEIGTHEIGKMILGDNYEEAVEALLSYDPDIAAMAEAGEIPEEASKRDEYQRHQACMLFMTGKDYDRAEKVLPRRFNAESCLLRHLNRAGKQSRKDFVGALTHITKGLRSMYLHAYQSYIWNHAASKRWDLYGSKVIKGDLVVVETEPTPVVAGKDQDGDDIVNPTDFDDERPVQARPLTEEEASSGDYTIHDIVLPSPGYEVIYPDNDIGEFYTDFMAREENGGLNPNKMRRIRREFSLPGRYRKVMNRFLSEPSVEVKAYSKDTDQMHPTDLDLIKAASAGDASEPQSKRVKAKNSNGEEKDSEQKEESGESEDESPQKISVIVKFQLGSSAYATVTLRELMGDVPEST